MYMYFRTAIRALIHLSISGARMLVETDFAMPYRLRRQAVRKLARVEQCAIVRTF
jgi:hypothetical protein